jgi:hypothetical protein
VRESGGGNIEWQSPQIPNLLVVVDGLVEAERLVCRAVDDRGVIADLKRTADFSKYGKMMVGFDASAPPFVGSKSLTLYFALDKELSFEFLVDPKDGVKPDGAVSK